MKVNGGTTMFYYAVFPADFGKKQSGPNKENNSNKT